MCVQTKSRDVEFLESMKEMESVHDNIPPSKQVKHIVLDEAVNDDELVKDVNYISLKKRPVKDVEGDEYTSNVFLKEEFAPPQDEGLNEPQQDGQRERL